MNWTVRALTAADAGRWRELYLGYAEFYREPMDDAALDRLWSWLLDDGHSVNCLLVSSVDGEVVGLAHYREFARPLGAATGLFLDDLFVDPARRGGGAARALIAELARLASERGATVVRWITAEDNTTAQALYDRMASRTRWLTYDLTP